MREKECIICGELFFYKNKSKKTCSNKCRQQFCRDNKAGEKLGQNGNNSFTDDEHHLNGLTEEYFKLFLDRTIALFKDGLIHISELRFLSNLVDVLEFELDMSDDLDEDFTFFNEFIEKVRNVAENNIDKKGYVSFIKYNTQKSIKRLKKMRKSI